MTGVNRFIINPQKTIVSRGIYDETVCGLIFDISLRSNVFDGFSLASRNYSSEQMQKLTSIEEAEKTGITKDGIMGGVPYYHLKHFFDMAAANSSEHAIYVVFADCSSNFHVLYRMMHESKKKIFQFGIWTEQYLFQVDGDGYTSQLMDRLDTDIFSFRTTYEPSDEYDLDIPFNVFLSANYNVERNNKPVSYRDYPAVSQYNIPGLTVLMGQENSTKVHEMQSGNVNNTQVGCVGAALGVMTICPVEYSLADNYMFNLKDVIPAAELGFGNGNTPIEMLNYVRRNELDAAGYVFLVNREDAIGETFFSNDRTLGRGDYNSIARCRSINKVHRIARTTLISRTNGRVNVDPNSGNIQRIFARSVEDEVYRDIDTYMGIGSSLNGSSQLEYRNVSIPIDQADSAGTKTLVAEIEIVPSSHIGNLKITEQVLI